MYICAHLPWNPDMDHMKRLITMTARLGYQAAIIHFVSPRDLKIATDAGIIVRHPPIEFPISVKSIGAYKRDFPIALFPCLSVRADNPNKLKQELSSSISHHTLIAVRASHKETLENAARDGRVDILDISQPPLMDALTKGILSLAFQNQCYLNLALTNFLESPQNNTRQLRQWYRLFLSTKPTKYQYVLGFDSTNEWSFRGPKESMAVLQSFFKFTTPVAKSLVSLHAESLVLRFIKRDQGTFIDDGVEIVDIIPPNSQKEDHP